MVNRTFHNRVKLIFQIGQTKIFLRAGHMAELDARRAYMLSNSATIIQKHTKTHFSRKTYTTLRKSSIFVQSICRGSIFVFYNCPYVVRNEIG